jgi:glycosyltransferase involved in cell wall biosynthesis
MSLLKKANEAFKQKKYDEAFFLYKKMQAIMPELSHIVEINLKILREKHGINDDSSSESKNKNIHFENKISNNEIQRFYERFNEELESNFVNSIYSTYKESSDKYKDIKISIIMPTYNRAKTIIQAINSIINQSHQNWELLIVDDGSTDNTKNILQNYTNDKRIQVLFGEHKGVSGARNKAIEASSGSIIAYLDSDNKWTEDYLLVMVVFLITRNLECAYSGTKIINSTGEILGYRGARFDWDECIKSNYIDMNIFIHKRELLSLGGFDENIKRAVDWDLILRYTKNHRTSYAPFIGCIYLDEKTEKHRITDDEPIIYGDIVYLKNKFNYNREEVVNNLKLKIAIKAPSPEGEKNEWGDYHYAISLKKALEKFNCIVRIDNYEDWYKYNQRHDRVVIVLRGLREYKPQKGQINILWNISHPDKILYHEYEQFNLVYIASNSYADLLSLIINKKTNVKALLQATEIHTPINNPIKNKKILFIGNSRKIYRNIVKWCIELNYEIEIYGTNWEDFVPKKFIKGHYIDNSKIKEFYSSYGVILNDHWDSMKDFGFISNRIFDVLSCGGNLISDHLESINILFKNKVKMIKSKEELKKALNNFDFTMHSNELQSDVNLYHSFESRAKEIVYDTFKLIGLKSDLNTIQKHKKYKINLLISNNETLNKSAYYRLIYPLTCTYAEGLYDIKIINSSFENGHNFHSCDLCFIQSSSLNEINCKKLEDLKNQYETTFVLDMDLNAQEFSKFDDIKKEIVLKNITNILFFSEHQEKEFIVESNAVKNIAPTELDARIWKKQYYAKKIENDIVRYLYIGDLTKSSSTYRIFYKAFQSLYHKYKNKFELIVAGNISPELKEPWLKNIAITKTDNYAKHIEKNIDLTKITFALIVDDENTTECTLQISIMEFINAKVYPMVLTENRYKNDIINTYILDKGNILLSLERTIENPQEFSIPLLSIEKPALIDLVDKILNSKVSDIKPVCFYLPQFYPTATNNKNWGEGFTEWMNVSKAKPRFTEHKQPKIPTKFGFYDLRLKEIMKQQSDYAREHGIYSFCFYYYRFGNHRELNVPVDNYQLLNDVIPYCYCWANESWTRAWDGETDEQILTQEYDQVTFNGIVDDLLIAMHNKNYLEHYGKPIFMIYQVDKIPNHKEWIKMLKEAILLKTKKELIIGGVYNHNITTEIVNELDFVVQFPPHRIPRQKKRELMETSLIHPFDPTKKDYFESYEKVIESSLSGHEVFQKTILSVCPDWDNSPRRAKNAHILIGSTPEKFEYWFAKAMEITKKKYKEKKIIEPFIFINAWNEWAEGAVLEPSIHEEDLYIKKIRDCLKIGGREFK